LKANLVNYIIGNDYLRNKTENTIHQYMEEIRDGNIEDILIISKYGELEINLISGL
jgi:hypothetical protein